MKVVEMAVIENIIWDLSASWKEVRNESQTI